MLQGKATGKSNLQTVVVGAQASPEGLAEITSGRSRWQQGVVSAVAGHRTGDEPAHEVELG